MSYFKHTKISNNTTKVIDSKICRAIGSPYTLASATTIGSYDITVTNATGLSAGDGIGLVESGTYESYFGKIISISTNTLTMDSPLPIVYSTSAVLLEVDCEMTVDGSTTPVVFSIKNGEDVAIDITRLLFQMVTDSAPVWANFGNITALTRGCLLRKKFTDGSFHNIANFKSNASLALSMYDLDFFSAVGAGADGVKGRMTFAGKAKHDAAIRLETNEELQMVIQDDLTTGSPDITSFKWMAQGRYINGE